jgi:hypothetical protein
MKWLGRAAHAQTETVNKFYSERDQGRLIACDNDNIIIIIRGWNEVVVCTHPRGIDANILSALKTVRA